MLQSLSETEGHGFIVGVDEPVGIAHVFVTWEMVEGYRPVAMVLKNPLFVPLGFDPSTHPLQDAELVLVVDFELVDVDTAFTLTAQLGKPQLSPL